MIELKQELYTIGELAALLRVTPRTIWNYVERYKIEMIRGIRKNLIPRREVEKMLSQFETITRK